ADTGPGPRGARHAERPEEARGLHRDARGAGARPADGPARAGRAPARGHETPGERTAYDPTRTQQSGRTVAAERVNVAGAGGRRSDGRVARGPEPAAAVGLAGGDRHQPDRPAAAGRRGMAPRDGAGALRRSRMGAALPSPPPDRSRAETRPAR